MAHDLHPDIQPVQLENLPLEIIAKALERAKTHILADGVYAFIKPKDRCRVRATVIFDSTKWELKHPDFCDAYGDDGFLTLTEKIEGSGTDFEYDLQRRVMFLLKPRKNGLHVEEYPLRLELSSK